MDSYKGVAAYRTIPLTQWTVVSFIPERDYLAGERQFVYVSFGGSLNYGCSFGREASRVRTCTYRFYNEALNKETMKSYDMQIRLHKALEDDGFVLHYQPKVLLDSRRIIGVEALVRLDDNGQLTVPNEFIGIAERSNLIIPIGERVLWEACEFACQHYLSGYELSVAVNLSRLQFRQPYIIDLVCQVFSETGLLPYLLQLEITEEGRAIMAMLKKKGIVLAIDDFGTGYSSLAYLRQFAVDQLKIDRSFIKDITDKDNGMIAKVILELARNSGLDVVAEGIDTQAQEGFLLAIGCKGSFITSPSKVRV